MSLILHVMEDDDYAYAAPRVTRCGKRASTVYAMRAGSLAAFVTPGGQWRVCPECELEPEEVPL